MRLMRVGARGDERYDDVRLPRGSTKTDWEVELTVVLGGVARYLESPADPQDLGLRPWVNGLQRQNGTTQDIVFDAGCLVWYLSQFMVLGPGDVVNTGTPAGVAVGCPDHPYLQAGDVVELEIDGLGRQRQTFREA